MIDKREILKLRAEGKTQKQISQDLRCHESYVWLVLKEAGQTSSVSSKTPIERLQGRLKKISETGCWEFQGSRLSFGYGQIKVNGVSHRAHVLSYSLFVGEVPDSMFVCHSCDNPPCCNPDHLFLGTAKENHADMVAKNRHAKGDKLPHAKVTNEMKIRMQDLKDKGFANRKIGLLLGVSHATVSRTLNA